MDACVCVCVYIYVNEYEQRETERERGTRERGEWIPVRGNRKRSVHSDDTHK